MNIVRKLIWKLAPPLEVTATCSCIREFLSGADSSLPPEVAERAIAYAKTAETTVSTIRLDHKTPEYLALVLIFNVIVDLLPSGRYHIYRGTLNYNGESMHRTFESVLKEMLDRGYATEEEVRKDREEMRRQIREVG